MRNKLTSIGMILSLLATAGCGLIDIRDRPPSGIQSETDFDRRIGQIKIVGLHYTHEHVVLRQMNVDVGDVYTTEVAFQIYRNLDQLKVFSSIHLGAEPNPDGTGIVLTVTVTEVNPYTPSVKIGITDENGLNVGLGGSSANLLGTALKANASVNFGGQSGFVAGISSPWRAGRLLSFDADFSWQVRDNMADGFRENAIELKTGLQRNIGRQWRLGAFYKLTSMGSDVDGITLDPSNRDDVSEVGLFGGFDSRDIPRNPTRGLFAYLDVGKAGGFIGGDADYWRGNLDLRAYWSPFPRHTLAAFSFNTRTTGIVGTDVAVWDDFHIGGTNTVRGWTYGARVGKNQSIATLEYRYMAVEPKLFEFWFIKMDLGLQLAIFGDAGTAFNTEQRPTDNFISGAGIGLRLILPSVDMIRFDFAAGQPSVGVSLHIGSHSKAVAQRNRIR